ncbi:MAG: peptide chain release factor N(5)-glutamine methyltransferase [Candidatus Woykebacteria bacterium]
MTIKEALAANPIDKIEAEIVLSGLLRKDRSFLYAHPEFRLSKTRTSKLTSKLKRRERGEPLAYILGYKEFYGLKFYVDKRVLIPRQETEELIEKVFNWIKKKNLTAPSICEVGTGSGCIAVTLAKLAPSAKIYAIDIDKHALEVAKKNAKLHGVSEKITFLQGDLLTPLSEKVDLIVANLPYIPTKKISSLQGELRDWEPRVALDGGTDGKELYLKLFKQAMNFLKPSGVIFYEVDGQVFKKSGI